MRTLMLSAALALSATAATAADPTADVPSDNGRILSFQTMYGVDGPFVGDANPIRGVIGDELPWSVRMVRGDLDSRGRLRIMVHGLVFADDPLVPPKLRGINDEAQFRALVSCLTEIGDSVQVQSVVSDGFPATRSGNSFIDARLELPDPCVAPIVMILAGSEDKWFAVSGAEAVQSSN